MASTAKDHAQIIWRMRLCSAFRAAWLRHSRRRHLLPSQIPRRSIKIPAFSYVIVVLIVSDATLGDTPVWRFSAWHGGHSGGHGRFLVVLPESTHLTAKRIALGQIALVCTEAVIARDDNKYGFMHPLHIGASTALGALACVLALLLPFPGLAHHKVQKLCKVYAENASERMKIYLKAFNAQDHQTKTELVLQAKPIAEMGNKLLQIIRISQEGMPWERPWSRYAKHDSINVVVNRLQSIELAIRAMEYSLVSSPSSQVQTLDQQQLSDVLQGLASQREARVSIQILDFSRPGGATRHDHREGKRVLGEPHGRDQLRHGQTGDHHDRKHQSSRDGPRIGLRRNMLLFISSFGTKALGHSPMDHLHQHSEAQQNMVKSLSNVVNMLYFVVYNLEQLSETQESGTVGKEFQKQLSYELEELQGTVNTSLETVSVMKSIADQSQDMLRELEEGKLQNREKLNDLIIEEALRITEEEFEDEKRIRIVRCLGAIGFCISSLRKEVDEVDICIKEIVRWENNSSK
ncbi:hypothetical protein DH2020_026162 [Rehmannia glutinosa]|uniref:Uncharacterized protein n=1 Tax=Rehmannia glutinosa TaxID=99300 RepID=A0ABR0W292_REHGL